jgi:hypothetical protein
MYRKLILVGAMTAAFTAPAFAEWNVLKPMPAPASGSASCIVVQRVAAATGEERIAGPFTTKKKARAAAAAAPDCLNHTSTQTPMKGSKP